MKRLKRRLLRPPKTEALSARRLGLREGRPEVRAHLDRIVDSVLTGYRIALEEDRPGPAASRLASVVPEFRGFAFEGAGIYFWLTEVLWPLGPRGRLEEFLRRGASPHVYMVYAGVGWAMARLPFSVERGIARLDPVLRWLAVDGYGFHEGFFHRRRVLAEQRVPRRIRGYGRRAFDQGLGRCLWFVEAAEVEAIAEVVGRFPPSRRGDLWSGVGLACCYAGGVDRGTVEALRAAATGYGAELAQGAAFAAKARIAGGNATAHTDVACEVLAGRPAAAAAAVADRVGEGLAADGEDPAYETWRRGIQQALAGSATAAPAPIEARG